DSYRNYGNVLRDEGQWEAALAWYAKAITTLTPVQVKNPSLVMARLQLRAAYEGRAIALDKLTRYADAARDWENAAALADQTSRAKFRLGKAVSLARASQHAPAVVEAEGLAQNADLTDETLYQLARIYALASAAVQDDTDLQDRYAARAVALLERVVESGYLQEKNAIESLKKDADFDALRERDDYQELIR